MKIVPTLSILSALAVTLTAGGGILIGAGDPLGWVAMAIGAGWTGILYGTFLRMLAVALKKEDTNGERDDTEDGTDETP